MAMRRFAAIAWFWSVLGAVGPAWAEPPLPPDFQDAISGYCDYVTGTADANADLLIWPEVFAGAGLVTGGTEFTGDETARYATSVRLTAGLRYEFMDLYRGLTDRAKATAECARFRASEAITSYLDRASGIGMRPALSAQAEVLKASLPEAEAILARAQERYAQAEATLEELNATGMRVHALRDQAWQIRETLAALPEGGPPDRAALDRLVGSFAAGDARVEELETRIRRIKAWDLGIRGGYDQVVGSDRLPVFALLTASFSMGRLGQDAANRRAEAGRRAWIRHSAVGLRQRVARLVRELEGSRGVERERLHQASVLLADLEGRFTAVSDLKAGAVRRFADYLWFDLVRTRAEKAYLVAYLAALDEFLGAGPQPIDDADMRPVRLGDLDLTHVTGGDVREDAAGQLVIDAAAVRGELRRGALPDRQAIDLRFVYDGPSRQQVALASGMVRTQIGAKLRAGNGCNLIYVMWRIAPVEGIVVFVKRNPGQTRHAECGARGYERVAPSFFAPVDPPAIGAEHRLRATLLGEKLSVTIDGERVWEGTLPDQARTLLGPVGLRADNGRFRLAGRSF